MFIRIYSHHFLRLQHIPIAMIWCWFFKGKFPLSSSVVFPVHSIDLYLSASPWRPGDARRKSLISLAKKYYWKYPNKPIRYSQDIPAYILNFTYHHLLLWKSNLWQLHFHLLVKSLCFYKTNPTSYFPFLSHFFNDFSVFRPHSYHFPIYSTDMSKKFSYFFMKNSGGFHISKKCSHFFMNIPRFFHTFSCLFSMDIPRRFWVSGQVTFCRSIWRISVPTKPWLSLRKMMLSPENSLF